MSEEFRSAQFIDDLTVEGCFNDPDISIIFKDFLKLNSASENFDFLDAVSKYLERVNDGADQEKRNELGNHLISVFLSQVICLLGKNIVARFCIQEEVDWFNQSAPQQATLSDGNRRELNETVDFQEGTFKTAQLEVQRCLEQNYLKDFKEHLRGSREKVIAWHDKIKELVEANEERARKNKNLAAVYDPSTYVEKKTKQKPTTKPKRTVGVMLGEKFSSAKNAVSKVASSLKKPFSKGHQNKGSSEPRKRAVSGEHSLASL